MVGAQYSCKVARLETKDGCPLGPGASLSRTFNLKPLSQYCGQERGLALDAALSKVMEMIKIKQTAKKSSLARHLIYLLPSDIEKMWKKAKIRVCTKMSLDPFPLQATVKCCLLVCKFVCSRGKLLFAVIR